MANTHRLLASRDCEYYRQRLQAVDRKFEQLIESLRLREQKGILPPRFVVEKVLTEMKNFAAQPPAENILATSFKSRVAKIRGMTEEQRAGFQRRIETAISDYVYLAYNKLIAYFEGVLPKTTTDDGVWKLPWRTFLTLLPSKKPTTTLIQCCTLRAQSPALSEIRTILAPTDLRCAPSRALAPSGRAGFLFPHAQRKAMPWPNPACRQAWSVPQLFATLPKRDRSPPVPLSGGHVGRAYYQERVHRRPRRFLR